MSLTLGDTPPAGVSILSFEVTITSASLQPGNVPIVTNPIRIELTKLETETAFLNTAGIAPGNYTGMTITFANPELTVLNNSGASIGACAAGQTCEINPPLTTATVSYTGAPFPLTISANNPIGLLVDFNVQNSVQSSLAVNPSITLTQLPPVQGTGGMEDIEDVVGQVTAKDTANNQFTLQTGGSQGQSLVIKVDNSTKFDDFEDGGMTNGFAAIAIGQVLKVDLALLPGGGFVAREVQLAENDHEGELEGEISSIVSPTQFKMVVVDEEPDVPGVQVGNIVGVNIQSGASFQVSKEDMSIPPGLTFSGAADLMIGQHVQIRPTAPPSGTPLTVTTDRVRLRLSRLTAQVTAVSAPNFTLGNLPPLFASATPAITQMQVQTSPQTKFVDVAGVSGLSAGNTVSVAGLLFKTSGTPVLLARKVRKR